MYACGRLRVFSSVRYARCYFWMQAHVNSSDWFEKWHSCRPKHTLKYQTLLIPKLLHKARCQKYLTNIDPVHWCGLWREWGKTSSSLGPTCSVPLKISPAVSSLFAPIPLEESLFVLPTADSAVGSNNISLFRYSQLHIYFPLLLNL